MADYIDLAKPLKLTTPGTAPIAGLVVADTAALEAIESPWLGMIVYVEANGKAYRVTELKDVSVGVFTKKAVKTCEVLPDKQALDSKLDADKLGAPGGAAELDDDGKVVADQLPDNFGASPAKITLPVPYDEDKDNVSLYLDIGTDPAFAAGTYTRIRMTDHYAKMKVFYNEQYHTLTEGHVGVPEYGASVSFALDAEMMPSYVAGNTYHARFTWMDSKGAYDDWKGFIFSGDVVVLEPIRTDYESPPTVKAQTTAAGTLSLDYLNGEIQNYTMSSNVTVSLDNVSNVPFGEALICNIRRTGGTLTVSNGTSNQTYTENKTYMVVVTNFGTMQIAVTETI